MTDSHSMARRLVANTVVSVVGQVSLLALAFFTTPYIIHGLGASLYGVLVLLSTYIEAFSLLNLGINASLVKYVSQMLPQRRFRDIQGYFGTALTLFGAGGMLVAFLATFAAPAIVHRFMKASPALEHEVIIAFHLATAAFLVRFVAQVFVAIPIAAQRFDISTSINASTELLRICGCVAAIYLGYSITVIFFISLVSSLLALTANLCATRILVPEILFVPSFSQAHFFDIFHFSKFVTVSNISSRVVNSTDVMIIGYFCPVASVAYYGIPYQLGVKLWALLGNISSTVFPASSALSGTGRDDEVRELYLRSSKLLAALACFPAVVVCIYGRQLLHFWLGREFAAEGSLALKLLIVAFCANSLTHVPWATLQSRGHVRITAQVAIVYAFCNVALFIAVIPFWGINGAAASFLCSQLLTGPWLIRAANVSLGIGWRTILKTHAPVATVTVLSGIAMLLVKPLAHSLEGMIAIAAIGTGVHMALCALLVLDAKERSVLASFVVGEKMRSPRLGEAKVLENADGHRA